MDEYNTDFRCNNDDDGTIIKLENDLIFVVDFTNQADVVVVMYDKVENSTRNR